MSRTAGEAGAPAGRRCAVTPARLTGPTGLGPLTTLPEPSAGGSGLVTEDDRAQAFRLIYDAHYRQVLAYARRRAPAGEADDVVADAFLVAWRRLDDVPAGERALPWLYGVARRVVADRRRAGGRRERLLARLAGLAPDEHEPNPAEFAWAGGSDGAGRDDGEVTRVRVGLAALRPADRELLRLSAWEELDNAGLAVALGVSVNAATIRLHRARRRLEQALHALQEGNDDPRDPSGGAGGDPGERGRSTSTRPEGGGTQ